MRWRSADVADGTEGEPGQGVLFDEVVERHLGRGEFRGIEFFHVNAQRIINEVPKGTPVPFRYTINAYRGCSHACSYCMVGDTPILMADGRTKRLAAIRVGDAIYGTVRRGRSRRYITTEVLARWSTVKPAYRVTLSDGTELVCSGDHRFLSNRGWKHVTGSEHGRARRAHLTLNNELLGTGGFALPPDHSPEYRRGYLCGMIRGDAHVGSYAYSRAGRTHRDVHRFRLALVDLEALRRAREYLAELGITTSECLFQEAVGARRPMNAIRTQTRLGVAAIRDTTSWPNAPSVDWCKGFLAGIFDAEGSFSRGIVLIANTDPAILNWTARCLTQAGFDVAIEPRQHRNGLTYLRIRGDLHEHLRFFHTVDPAITRKRSIEGTALKGNRHLRVTSIERLGVDLPMFDITTGTGDFIADGVVSHNCFARPTHTYLDFDAGEDFERKIVVKVNAVERVRAELVPSRWAGYPIAMGTNTDPYQRCEGKYRLTRGIVAALARARNPFSILTKSTLILRDLDVLTEAAKQTEVRANFSIATLDDEVWRTTEPGTPHPRQRVEAVARLNDAGIPCGVLVAPVLPGLSDAPEQLEAIVKACVDAGAVSISAMLLHLRPGVREHWFDWLQRERPDLVDEHERLYPRAYAPKARQHELSRLVVGLVRRHRPEQRSRRWRPDSSVPEAPVATRGQAARQLPLDL